MPNGDILSQLGAPQGNLLGGPPEPQAALPGPQAPPPSPDASGGGFGDFLGGLGQGLQQASPMLLASVVGQTMGPEAMGAFMAGITSGQIQRQQLAQQQQRIDLETARFGAAQEAQAAEQKAAQTGLALKAQEQDIKIVEDAIEERLGLAQQMIESGHPAAADDIRKGMKGFLQTMLTNHPGAAKRYSPEEIELRFPKTMIEAAYEQERRDAAERFYKNHEKYYQNLFATGGEAAVRQDIANLPPFDLGDGDPVPAAEFLAKYGPEFGFAAAGPGGDLSIRLPQPEQETVTVQEDVPGAPKGTRRTRIVPKPSGELPEEGVVVGGQRTPRPPQPPAAFFSPTLREITGKGGEKRLVPIIPGQLPQEGIQAEPPPTPDPGKQLDRLIDQMILDAMQGVRPQRNP